MISLKTLFFAMGGTAMFGAGLHNSLSHWGLGFELTIVPTVFGGLLLGLTAIEVRTAIKRKNNTASTTFAG